MQTVLNNLGAPLSNNRSSRRAFLPSEKNDIARKESSMKCQWIIFNWLHYAGDTNQQLPHNVQHTKNIGDRKIELDEMVRTAVKKSASILQ